ncbi:hypothetical protein DDZ18_00145 [Marinicauda salina]|jgi:hypothetical protein|uniref:DUF4412 domain-containing protein n=1 Tax=Marinicauda salina TaxID=2135793 RepID=A0A2U2BVM0_9PROT|nr:hypothetical protein [Marinicauda salina]PWE18063.1 hypothetical protein DDZ18_00145 [Marinicauda salina]
MRNPVIGAAIAAVLTAAPAFAGHIFEVERTSPDGETLTNSMRLEDGKFVMEEPGDPQLGTADSQVIFRNDPARLISVDHGARTYNVMTPEDLEAGMASMRAMMDEALQNAPPEQREAMRQAMGGAMPGAEAPDAPAIEPTGRTRRVSGAQARQYEVRKDGRRSHLVWAVAPGAITGGRELADLYGEMAVFADGMSMMANVGWMYDLEGNFDGRLPLVVEEFGEDGELDATTRITAAGETDIPASAFEPPEDYSEVEAFGP